MRLQLVVINYLMGEITTIFLILKVYNYSVQEKPMITDQKLR